MGGGASTGEIGTVDMNIIQHDWQALAGRRMQFAHAFYERLFERHPRYRGMFPESLDSQMEKMVEMFSGIARFSDHTDLVRPYLTSVGYAHRRLGIHEQDVENFKQAFVETLAELRGDKAWNTAFDDMIVPMFDEGLETGRS